MAQSVMDNDQKNTALRKLANVRNRAPLPAPDRECVLQNFLAAYPSITREEAFEMFEAQGL